MPVDNKEVFFSLSVKSFLDPWILVLVNCEKEIKMFFSDKRKLIKYTSDIAILPDKIIWRSIPINQEVKQN